MYKYYKILGLDSNATEQEIKKAYRNLAKTHHPDLGGDPTKFQEITEAYNALINPKSSHSDSSWRQSSSDSYEFDPAIFETIFGQNSFWAQFQARSRSNQNVHLATEITLEQAYSGVDFIANFALPSGREEKIELKIPAGVPHCTTMRIAGIGDDTYSDRPRGDVLLTIHVAPHSRFIRENNDLLIEEEIDAFQAMLGSVINVTTMTGKQLEVKTPPGLQHGSILGVADHGMPDVNHPSVIGRLLVKIKIVTPIIPNDLKSELLEVSKKYNARNSKIS